MNDIDENRIVSIAEEIRSKLVRTDIEMALAMPDKESRCGQIGIILRDAVKKCNLALYRGIEHWWSPESGYWIALEKNEITLASQYLIRSIGMSPADIFKREQRISQMMRDSIFFKQLRPKKGLITFSNATLDVDTGKAEKRSSSFHTIYGLPYAYDPTAECPKWNEFLSQVIPDSELRMLLQEYLGCVFIDRQRVKLEKMLYLLGSGSNGKGVIFETIRNLVGADNITSYDLSVLAANNNEYAIASVDGKILNYCSDADKATYSNSKAKSIISGEPTPARLPYGQPFTAQNIPVLMVNTNEMPATNDHSYGAKRRLMIIPMNVTIPEHKQNHRLHIELMEERSGILNWIFEGRERLIANDFRFTRSKAAEAKLAEYEVESNSILLFLQDRQYYPTAIFRGQQWDRVSSSDSYQDYRGWCISQGLKPFSQKAFSAKLKDRGFIFGRYGNGVVYSYYKIIDIDEFQKHCANDRNNIDMETYLMIIGSKGDEALVENMLNKGKDPMGEDKPQENLTPLNEIDFDAAELEQFGIKIIGGEKTGDAEVSEDSFLDIDDVP